MTVRARPFSSLSWRIAPRRDISRADLESRRFIGAHLVREGVANPPFSRGFMVLNLLASQAAISLLEREEWGSEADANAPT
jgi:hypothetical protein